MTPVREASEPTTHYLKTWPEFFEAIIDGRKPFEWRVDDRGFKVGDTLVLQEYIPNPENPGREGTYTGREITRKVSYLFGCWPSNKRTVVMALSAAPGEPCAVKPITMSDVRLIAGEGKLSAHDVLAAVNGHLRMHPPQPAAGWDEENKRLRAALENAAGRFNLMGGVGLVNGADPKVGYRECMEVLRREAPAPAEGVLTLGPENEAFHRALKQYPEGFAALHFFWNEVFAGQPQSRPDTAEARYRHKKRGTTYTVIGQAQVQCDDGLTDYEIVTVYRGDDGELWVRRKPEFEDRFEALSPPSGGDEAKESEGGEPDGERTQRRLAVSDDGLGPMQAIPREPPSGPSDPTPPDREAVARIIRGVYGIGYGPFAGGHQNESVNRAADAILALTSGGR